MKSQFHKLAANATVLSVIVSGLLLASRPAICAPATSWKQCFEEGSAALEQQKPQEAEDLFRQACQLVKAQSKDAGDIEKCLRKLADTLALRDETAEAQSIYRQLLGSLQDRYGKDSSETVPVLYALGSIQEAAGDHAAAMTFYRQALAINEKHYGPYSPAVADVLHRLARSTANSGDKKGAQKHYKRAMAILAQQPGLEASKQMEGLVREYGDLLKGADDSDRQLIRDFQDDVLKGGVQTSPGREKTVPDQAPHLPSESPAAMPQEGRIRLPQSEPSPATTQSSAWQKETASTAKADQRWRTNEDPQVVLRGLARPSSESTLAPAYRVIEDSLFNQNRYEKGEDSYQRTIAADIDALGPYHPAVANDLVGLSKLYIFQKRYSEAKPLLARALAIYEGAYGSDNALTIKTRATLASVEFQLGNADNSAALYRTALSAGQSALGPNSLETANILNQLANLYFNQGKLENACTFYGWALASTRGAVGENDPLYAACLKDYARVLRRLGRSDEAESFENRAEKILASAR